MKYFSSVHSFEKVFIIFGTNIFMRSDMNVCRSYNTVFSNATDSVRKKVVIEVKTVYNNIIGFNYSIF